MTTPTEALITALRAHTGLQALLTNGDSPATYRIHNMILPQDIVMPAMVVRKVAQLRENTLAPSGGSGVDNMRARVTMYADTLAGAEAVSEQCRLALVAAASVSFKSVQLLNVDDYDDVTGRYQVACDYSIYYKH